jgi:hypothetical protein
MHAADAQHDAEWQVNVTDDETRTMHAQEIAWGFLSGALDPDDVFVWRDGMDDWIPLGQCAELQTIIRQYKEKRAPAPSLEEQFGSTVMMDLSAHEAAERSPAHHPVAAVEDEHPLAGTMIMVESGAPSDREVSRTMASPVAPQAPAPRPLAPPSLTPAPPPAAPGARPRLPAPPPRRGERNEASSLFSVEEMQRGKRPSAPAKERDPFADIMSLGGGSSGGIAAALAPPPIFSPPPPAPAQAPISVRVPHAPPTPYPPAPQHGPPPSTPPYARAHSAPPPPTAALAAAQLAPKKKSNLGLIIGGAAAALVVTAGAITFIYMRAHEPVAANERPTATQAEEAAPRTDGVSVATDKAAEDPQATEPASASASADEADAPAPDASGSAPEPEASGDTPVEPGKTPAVDPRAPAPAASSAEKADDKPEFNRDAARAALDSAAGAASGCKQKGGPTGRGRVTVTFAPSGRATQASVGPPFAGTPVGSCAANAFRGASVPPFSGGPVTVSKSFFIK